MLNLFGYTGLASLVAARAGAEVTHVDASKKAIGWARENQEMAGLADKPIRWICEDAMKFAEREERRGSRYDIILFDPPAYGRGPKGEVWQLFEDLPALTDICRAILTPKPLAVVLTAYSIRASFFAIHALMRDTFAGMGGTVESGELVIREKIGRPRAVDLAVLALGGVMNERQRAGRRAGPGQGGHQPRQSAGQGHQGAGAEEIPRPAERLHGRRAEAGHRRARPRLVDQDAGLRQGRRSAIRRSRRSRRARSLPAALVLEGQREGAVGHHPARQSADGGRRLRAEATCR